MKKITVLLLSMFLLFSVTSCTQPASQPAKGEVKRALSMDEDVVDIFPQLKEVREYLLANYPLTRKEQEKEVSRTENPRSMPIKFYYADGTVVQESEKQITTYLFFEETVTKKQMIEAINYVSEKMNEIFPEDDEITVEIEVGAFVNYTKNGILQDNLRTETEAFAINYKRNAPKDVKWEVQAMPYEWIPFDPSTVQEGEKPQYIVENPTKPEESAEPEQPAEQPQEEAPKEEPAPAPAGLGGVKLSELKDYLSSADVEEFSFEEGNGIYTSTGIDPTKTYGYTAVTGSDKETLQGVVYMITRKENLTNDEYLELCEMYLTAGATFGYEGVDTGKATSFIENNMETILATGESKSQTFGNLSFTITYADNTANLIILNPNEQ